MTDLEEEKMDLLREYFTAIQTLKTQAAPPAPAVAPQQAPQQGPGVVPPQPSMSPASGVQV